MGLWEFFGVGIAAVFLEAEEHREERRKTGRAREGRGVEREEDGRLPRFGTGRAERRGFRRG